MMIRNNITLYVCIVTTITGSLYASERPSLQAEGLSGWVYAQSWLLTKPQLLLYTFEHNFFECNDDAHKELLDEALVQALKDMDIETIEKILTTIKQKFPDNNSLVKTETNKYIHDYLTTLQKGFVLHAQSELPLMQQQQLAQLAVTLGALQKEQERITMQLLGYKTEQEKQLEVCRTHYRQCAGLTQLLDGDSGDIQLGDVEYMNKQMMSYADQFGKNNVFIQSLITDLSLIQKSTQKLLTISQGETHDEKK